jgi:hypothetical protein
MLGIWLGRRLRVRSDRFLWNVCMEIYRKMYREARPKANLDKLIKSGETQKPEWFMFYYLPKKRQEEIFEKVCRKYRLTKRERKAVSFEIHLGSAPCSNYNTWRKYRMLKMVRKL